MKIFIFFFLLIFIGLGILCVKSQTVKNPTIILKNEKDLLLVGKQTYFLEDKSRKLTIEDILKLENQQKFQLVNKDVFTNIPTQSKFWLKLTIQNLTGKEAWIELGSTYLWYIDYFVNQNEKYVLTKQTGPLRPESNKAYPSNVFWLPIGNNQKIQTLYLCVDTEGLVEIPLKLGTILSLSQEKVKGDYLLGGFVGLMLVMFAYNLFLFFATGDRIYIPYLGYVLTSIFSASYLNNYPILAWCFSESYQPLVYIYVYVWLGLPFVFIGYFSTYFLNLAKHSSIFRWLVQLNIFIFIFLIPLINLFTIIPFYIQAILYQLFTLFYSICLLSICFYLLVIKKEKNASFYTIGWFWAILGVIIYILCMNGVLPYHFLIRNSIFFGVSIEVLMFSWALGDRINRLKEEKDNIQKENAHLIREQNRILEKRLAERIIEINHYQGLLEQTGRMAGIGAWEWDVASNKITRSAVTKEIHGVEPHYEPAPALENSNSFYKTNEDIRKFEEAIQRCTQDGTPFDIELELINGKGQEIWVRVLGNAEYKDGKYVRLYGTFQDIDARKRAELEVKEVKEKLSNIFNSISEVVWSVRLPDYKMLLMTPSAVDLYGIGFEDFMGDHTYWEKAIHPDDKAIIQIIYQELATKGSYYQEYRIVAIDGKVKWISNNGKIIFDENNNPIRLDGLITDITQRKQAELETQLAKEKLSSIFSSISEMVWSLSLPNRKTILITPSAEDILEIPLTNLMKNYKLWETIVHPDDKEMITTIRQALHTNSSYSYEYRVITQSGKLKWLNHSGKLIFNDAGIPIRMDGMISDITKRKQAEEALIEEHKLLRTIIDNIPINIYVKDTLSRKTMINRAELIYMGVEDELEIIGKSNTEIYTNDSAQISIEEDKYVIETGKSILGKEALITKLDGTQKWFLISKIPLKNQFDQITGLLGISYDFTHRKQAEEVLIQTLEELQSAQETLEQQAEEISSLNNHLEDLVEVRTRQLSQRNAQLNDYAFFNAHKLRAPIATILGLYQVLDLGVNAEEKEMIIQKLRESVVLLDEMVRKSQSLLDEVED